jgi:DNA-directed RNA polymerase specialized sigma24 family protein
MQDLNDKSFSRLNLGHIRKALRLYFRNEGFRDPKELADDVITRVFLKINREGEKIQLDEPLRYFLGVAKKVRHEYWRRQKKEASMDFQIFEPSSPDSESIEDIRLTKLCLEKCMELLNPEDRELIKQFLEAGKHYTKELKDIYNLKPNAIRVRIFRIIRNENEFRECIKECLKR